MPPQGREEGMWLHPATCSRVDWQISRRANMCCWLHLAGGHGYDTGTIESVSFACHWALAIGGSGDWTQVVNSMVDIF